MDYSQFLLMHHEIGLLIVFILVFLFDTFGCKKVQGSLSVTALVLFGAFTVYGFFAPQQTGEAFAGMYATSPIVASIKNILNIGMFIVLLQSIKWNNSETQSVRRGEFLELMLVTLFGMYLMVSARHFLIFVIGLETASLPLAALAAFDKKQYESHEAAVKYLFTAVFSSAIYMLGLSFVYAFTGSLYFSDIAASVMLVDGQFLLYVAMAFVIAGIGFKISLVPFHLWTADVYQGAPTSVLAARHQAQTEAGLIEQDIGRGEQQRGHEHEPAELERAEIDGERLLRTGILHDGGNVIGIRSGVDGLDDDRRACGAEQIQRGADKRLVRLEVDAGHGQQAGIDHADQRRNSQNAEDHHDGGHIGRNVAHRQRAAEGAHDHNALKAEVDDAGVLREAAAEGDQDQHGSKDQGVLQQQYHY